MCIFFRDWCAGVRCRANMAHVRRSRPDYGLAKLGKLLKWATDAHVVSEVPL